MFFTSWPLSMQFRRLHRRLQSACPPTFLDWVSPFCSCLPVIATRNPYTNDSERRDTTTAPRVQTFDSHWSVPLVAKPSPSNGIPLVKLLCIFTGVVPPAQPYKSYAHAIHDEKQFCTFGWLQLRRSVSKDQPPTSRNMTISFLDRSRVTE